MTMPFFGSSTPRRRGDFTEEPDGGWLHDDDALAVGEGLFYSFPLEVLFIVFPFSKSVWDRFTLGIAVDRFFFVLCGRSYGCVLAVVSGPHCRGQVVVFDSCQQAHQRHPVCARGCLLFASVVTRQGGRCTGRCGCMGRRR